MTDRRTDGHRSTASTAGLKYNVARYWMMTSRYRRNKAAFLGDGDAIFDLSVHDLRVNVLCKLINITGFDSVYSRLLCSRKCRMLKLL